MNAGAEWQLAATARVVAALVGDCPTPTACVFQKNSEGDWSLTVRMDSVDKYEGDLGAWEFGDSPLACMQAAFAVLWPNELAGASGFADEETAGQKDLKTQ